ncbi:MAG: hypothetical protein PHC88_08375 [Terrimicrobiaceae bacterium]|nr:hypothetical protein [Terrimicrobiaceae bacterium]
MNADSAARLSRLRDEGGFFSIAGVARFAASGADRIRYLNGQISNDLRKLVAGRAMQACILSAKGRLDAVVWLWAEPERIIVETDAALAESLAARLERYIVSDDVEISALPGIETLHVFGRQSVAGGEGGRAISRLNVPGFDLESPEAREQVTAAGLMEATAGQVESLRIAHRVPKWGHELGPDTLPAEAGLDATAVDFYKGCYIGQEVVSRIRSVGHANRELRAFDVIAGNPPAVGAEFFLPGQEGRAAAVVTSVDFALSSRAGLCYMRRGTTEGAALTTPSGDSTIQLRQLEHPNA